MKNDAALPKYGTRMFLYSGYESETHITIGKKYSCSATDIEEAHRTSRILAKRI